MTRFSWRESVFFKEHVPSILVATLAAASVR